MRRWAVALVAVLAAAAACSDDVDVRTSPTGDGWVETSLGEPGDDTQSLLVSDGETLVAVTSGPGGGLRSWVVEDDGAVTAGEVPPGTGPRLVAAAAGKHGFVATAIDYEDLLPVIWHSGDGRTWTKAEGDALDSPGDPNTVVATDDGFVVAGARRVGEDPSNGPFAPAVWRSTDGRDWELVELDAEGEGSIGALAAVDGAVLATGFDGDRQVLWRSDDLGGTWREDGAALPDEVDHVLGMGAIGDTLVVVDGDSEGMVGGSAWVSDDAGSTWARATVPNERAEGIGQGLWFGARSVFGLVGTSGSDPWSDPARCYDDLAACEAPQRGDALYSRDGSRWHHVDLAELVPAPSNVYDVGASPGGHIVLFGSTDELVLWTWLGDDDPPAATTTTTAPASDAPPMAGYDDTLEVGTVYRYPLGTHCGLGFLPGFNGIRWALATSDEGGRDGWPMVGELIFGFVRLTAPDRIEYAIDETFESVIATYVPYEGDEPPVGCA